MRQGYILDRWNGRSGNWGHNTRNDDGSLVLRFVSLPRRSQNNRFVGVLRIFRAVATIVDRRGHPH